MAITFDQVGFAYQKGTPLEHRALKQVSFEILDHSYTAIIGHTGSGKSTLLAHLNGLLKPTEGTLTVNGQTITPKTKNKELGALRRQVGFVFQFPEAQLFEETVLKDIAFGPKNFGKSEEEALALAEKMAQVVNLPQEVWTKSPFDLSGGQMRRVAIAGILALEPQILILDEPTAGLDPVGQREMMALFKRLHEEKGLTIILVTHNMDYVADYADQVLVMQEGQLLKTGTPKEIFADPKWLLDHHLGLPRVTEFAYRLKNKGVKLKKMPLKLADLATELTKLKGDYDG